jgi:DNA-binding NarL/FixJ family response regulator
MSSILIVDSSPLMRNTVAHRLRDAGFTAHGASDNAEAMELLEGVAVDAVVLELQLRHGSGLELLRALRNDALFKVLPVIVYTQVEDAKQIKQAARLKASAVLYKDRTDFEELLEAIERQLPGRKSERGASRKPTVTSKGSNGAAHRTSRSRATVGGRRARAR